MLKLPRGRTQKYWAFRIRELHGVLQTTGLTFRQEVDIITYQEIRKQERDDEK